LVCQKTVVFCVAADPEPHEVGAILNGQGAVMDSDPRRPEPAYATKMQRGVLGVSLEVLVAAVRQPLNFCR
jgi:hypothetical protein